MYHYKDKHPCQRECVDDAEPMNCHYVFHVEWYYTMSKACFDCPYNITDCNRLHCIPADGMKRAITIVNRQMPGPSVDVCVGDRVIVDLQNGLMEESTSIHWHGHHQVDSPYMDGVPHLTQCPVPPRTSFRYRFEATSPGTHFWHSHTGSQRGDGAFGAFIIRKPNSQEVQKHLYEFDLPEHTMLMTDWSHMLGVEMFNAHHHSDGDNKPPTLLMNGKGLFKEFPLSDNSGEVLFTPAEVFTVKRGHSYRFRIINAGFLNCPIELSIDGHTLTAISSDGGDIKATTVDSLVSYAGERWDFVLTANQNVSNYWIKMRGLMDCDERFTSAFQVAILRYEGAKIEDPSGVINYEATRTTGKVLNPLNTPSNQNKSILISELTTLQKHVSDVRLRDDPDLQYYISYDFYEKDNPHFHLANMYGFNQVLLRTEQVRTPQINHLSFKFPSFPLLSQRDQIDESMFCANQTTDSCNNGYCECTNVVKVPLHAVVELIIIDEGVAYDANHPFHLHGHPFRVVAMERVGKTLTREDVIEMDANGLIHRNLESAPLKDTVTVPDGGFTIIRFHATNPGYWLFHCHIEFHVETGMAMVFKVGEHEDMLPVPANFPKCNDYYYDLAVDNDEVMNESTTDFPISTMTPEVISTVTNTNDKVLNSTQGKDNSTNDFDLNTEISSTKSTESSTNIHYILSIPDSIQTASNVHKNEQKTEVPSSTKLEGIEYSENNSKNKLKYNEITEQSKDKFNKTNTFSWNTENNDIKLIGVYDTTNQHISSNNNEENDLSLLSSSEDSIPLLDTSKINFNKTESDTKESNSIFNSRWFRSTSPISGNNRAVMTNSTYLIATAVLIVFIVVAIIFSMYKALSLIHI